MENTLRTVVLLLCSSGFVYILVDQVRQWNDGKRSSATSFRAITSTDFPVIVFCADRVFKGSDRYEPYVPSAEYRNRATNLSVEIGGLMRFENDPEETKPNATVEDLFTIYNGLCQTVVYGQKLENVTSRFFRLHPSSGESMTIFLLSDSSEQVFVVINTVDRNVVSMKMNSSVIVGLTLSESTILSTKDTPCLSDSMIPPNYTYSSCLVKEMAKQFKLANAPCASAHFIKFIPGMKECNSTDDIRNASSLGVKIAAGYATGKDNYGCLKPCTKMVFQAQPIGFTLPYNENATGKWYFLARFLSNIVPTQEEYTVITFINVISAVGGALGLFLGWSFYQSYTFAHEIYIKWNENKKENNANIKRVQPKV